MSQNVSLVKGKVAYLQAMMAYGGMEAQLQLLFLSPLDGGGQLHDLVPLSPYKQPPTRTEQDALWGPQPV